jgi:tetratricopeptide (TPR) repeat protein
MKTVVAIAALIIFSALSTTALGEAVPEGSQAAASEPTLKEIPITSQSPEAVESFKKGREYSEDVRTAEAEGQFKKAIALDPNFALAHAYLGELTPGAPGLKHLESAVALAKNLPEPERMLVDIMLAERRGEEERARTLRMKLVTVAPEDWRAHLMLGFQLTGERKWDEAIAAMKKTTQLNPNAGSAYNALGYNYLAMGKNEQAIQAFQKYVSVDPGEPNPRDSLAEALMAAGRLEEAEATFRKAAEISPDFWIAWDGVAQTRFLRGDWAGGRDALAKAASMTTRPIDKLEVDATLAWSYAAEGNMAEALKGIDALEKEAAAKKVDVSQASAPIERAEMLVGMGTLEDALKQVALGMEKAEKLGLPGGSMNAVRRYALATRIDAEAKLGRAADAKKTLALIEEEANEAPSNAALQSMVHFARGSEAMARTDAKAAAQHFAKCFDEDYYYRLQFLRAQEQTGDKSGATMTRNELLTANRRGSEYLYVRSEVTKPAPGSAAK